MNISFECLDCKKIWNHSIRGNKNYILLLYGKIDYFLSQQNEMTRSESEGYSIIKGINKEHKDEDLDNLKTTSVGTNKKLEDNLRNAQIPKIEMNALRAIENQLGEKFVLVKKIGRNTSICSTVKSNRVIGIGLRGRELSTLPKSIGLLKSLKIVALSYNDLTSFPEFIENLKSLEILYLDNNKLTILPESIGNLESLQTLILNRNYFETLPESIGDQKSLRTLGLCYNKFSVLPKSIGNLKSLEILSLGHNKFTTLPESIGNLKYLEFLGLDDNKISTLPEFIGNLESLRELHIKNNLFTTLPETIKILAKRGVMIEEDVEEALKKIVPFRKARIPRFEVEVLKTLEKQLGKQFKLIKEIKGDTQMGFIAERNRVIGIGMNNCDVSSLPESIGDLTSLQELYLYNNKLTTLPESIGEIEHLQTLGLSNNALETLPESKRK